MKIAQFQRVGDVTPYIIVLTDEQAEVYARTFGPHAYLRLSEWVQVDFVPRPDMTEEWRQRLDAEEARIRQDSASRLARISAERAQLNGRAA